MPCQVVVAQTRQSISFRKGHFLPDLERLAKLRNHLQVLTKTAVYYQYLITDVTLARPLESAGKIEPQSPCIQFSEQGVKDGTRMF